MDYLIQTVNTTKVAFYKSYRFSECNDQVPVISAFFKSPVVTNNVNSSKTNGIEIRIPTILKIGNGFNLNKLSTTILP